MRGNFNKEIHQTKLWEIAMWHVSMCVGEYGIVWYMLALILNFSARAAACLYVEIRADMTYVRDIALRAVSLP